MQNLTTMYLGMKLRNPLVVSPSPLCTSVDNIRRMEDAGAAAVVLHSLFEEQLRQESNHLNENLLQGTDAFAESLSYFPDLSEYRLGPDNYLELIRRAKETVDIPIIGSLNGVSEGGWTEYARLMEEAGADAIELNEYFLPTSPDMSDGQVQAIYEDLVRSVKANVAIPVAVKIAPFFTALPYAAKRLADAGADALVLFNRFYQPDFDLDALEVKPDAVLSGSSTLRLRLRWVAILYGNVPVDLAITGGVHTHEDVIKAMMAGAQVAMMTSALLRNGIGHLTRVRDDLIRWMGEREYDSIEMMQGSMSQRSVPDPAAFERANYMRVITSYTPGG
ncbi:MAG TPA: dihydroorotate dehydrogenase-like protein [Candidatus Hydrogenedentes bacterium]|nr:dihydroorotate dehydrogenase-like protein [Candidatus Hydrogenedentota bacterium]